MHQFSEKMRFDKHSFANAEKATGMAATPCDTGACEPRRGREGRALPSRAYTRCPLRQTSHVAPLSIPPLTAEAISEASSQTEEGQTHGVAHQSPETLKHVVRRQGQAEQAARGQPGAEAGKH